MDETPKSTEMTADELSALAAQLISKAMPPAMQEAIDKKKEDAKDGDADDKKDDKEKVDKAADCEDDKVEKSILITDAQLDLAIQKAMVVGAQLALARLDERLAPLEKSAQAIINMQGAAVEILQDYKVATERLSEVSKSNTGFLANIAAEVSAIGKQPSGRKSLDTSDVVKSVEVQEEVVIADYNKVIELNKAKGLVGEEAYLRTMQSMRGNYEAFSKTEKEILGVK